MSVDLSIVHVFCVRRDEVALHSVWMQHGDRLSDALLENALTTFQNFCGTIAQCFKISSQRKTKDVSLSLIV